MNPQQLQQFIQTLRENETIRNHVSLNFETTGRYRQSTSGAGAAITFGDGSSGGTVQLASGTTATGSAALVCDLGGAAAQTHNIYDYNPMLVATNVYFDSIVASQTASGYVVFGDLATDFSLLTRKHFGFELKDNNGTAELYATSSDGTTRKTTQIKGFTLTNPNTFSARLLSTRGIEFRVNGQTVAVHQSLFPSGSFSSTTNTAFMVGVNSSAGTTSKLLHVGHACCSWLT